MSDGWRPGDLVGGRYRVLALLGRGGMGEVLRARDESRDVDVAVKALSTLGADRVDLARFEREASLAASLDRLEGVVRVHASGVHAGRPYYVMELAEGRALDALAAEGLPPARAAAIVARVAHTLAACHARGVVHRDVKPHNVVVGPEDRPRLLDFGLARDLGGTRLTASGDLLGTPAYMAPELLSGAPADARTDVYGLGATLHHALTGQAPFRGDGLGVLADVARGAPPGPRALAPGTPAALDAVVLRAMARDPAGRYADAGALAQDLERFLAGAPVEAAGRPRRRALGLALAALALGLAAALGVAASRGPDRAALEEALERDGLACALGRRACTGGSHALVAWALGTGPGPAPALGDVEAGRLRLAALVVTPDDAPALAFERSRLASHARLLRHARGEARAAEEEGPTADLVDALLALDAHPPDPARACRRVAAAAARPDAPPGIEAVLARALGAAQGDAPPDDVAAALAALGRRALAAAPAARAWAVAAYRRGLAAALELQPGRVAASVADLASVVAVAAAPPLAGPDTERALAAVKSGALEAATREVKRVVERLRRDGRSGAATALVAALRAGPASREAEDALEDALRRENLRSAEAAPPGDLAGGVAALRLEALLRQAGPDLPALPGFQPLAEALAASSPRPFDPELALGLLSAGSADLFHPREREALDDLTRAEEERGEVRRLLAERPGSQVVRYALAQALHAPHGPRDPREILRAAEAVFDAPTPDLAVELLGNARELVLHGGVELALALPPRSPAAEAALATAEAAFKEQLAFIASHAAKPFDVREGFAVLAVCRYRVRGLGAVEDTLAEARAHLAATTPLAEVRDVEWARLLAQVAEWTSSVAREDPGLAALTERLTGEVLAAPGFARSPFMRERVQDTRAFQACARRALGHLDDAEAALRPALEDPAWSPTLALEVAALSVERVREGTLPREAALARLDRALAALTARPDDAARVRHLRATLAAR